MLISEPGHFIVAPNNRDVSGACFVCTGNKHAHERGGLDRSLNHDFLAGGHVHTLANNQVGIALHLGLDVHHSRTCLFCRQLNFVHTIPFRIHHSNRRGARADHMDGNQTCWPFHHGDRT